MDTSSSPELAQLNPFVGSWNTTGELINSASGTPSTFKALDRYEWLPAGKFLLHHFEADMPDGKVQGIEVIGFAADTDSFPMYSFDSTGTVTHMLGRVENNVWTFTGDSLRFTGGFRNEGNTFEGLWESRDFKDAAWQPLMEISLKKKEAI